MLFFEGTVVGAPSPSSSPLEKAPEKKNVLDVKADEHGGGDWYCDTMHYQHSVVSMLSTGAVFQCSTSN